MKPAKKVSFVSTNTSGMMHEVLRVKLVKDYCQKAPLRRRRSQIEIVKKEDNGSPLKMYKTKTFKRMFNSMSAMSKNQSQTPKVDFYPKKQTKLVPPDGIEIKYPLRLDVQSVEEFKQEILNTIQNSKVAINGFMMKEIDKKLTQTFFTSKKSQLNKNKKKGIKENNSKLYAVSSNSEIKDSQILHSEVQTPDEKAFKNMIYSHYYSKIQECNEYYEKLMKKKPQTAHEQKRRKPFLMTSPSKKKKKLHRQGSIKNAPNFQNEEVNDLLRSGKLKAAGRRGSLMKVIDESKRLFLPNLSKRMNKIKNYRL
ncbi:unnamed protein product [Moneuplotes crassus]|uniref:Uncharacterized protein n=1 Tax=Euplotes crassus TaxID=5936 RepID=A0AAD1XMA2_EUPCR|nr:unnamed protein product [Moneuplotes crassus]